MSGSLYVVSTPIGNLDDITLRALQALKAVGLIAAEDTRRTGILLHHFGITTPSTSLHAHNEQHKLPHLIEKLAGGTDIALVSDAGTPLVADPGQRLITAAIGRGIRVIPIPGASAVLAALAVSGFPGDEFVFAGFAPARSNSRKVWLGRFVHEQRPVVFFETPHRISKTLLDVASLFGERPIIVARELTKLHEEVLRARAKDAAEVGILEKGEFTVVLGPVRASEAINRVADDSAVEAFFAQMTKTGSLSRRAALAVTAREFGLSTNAVYVIVERVKSSAP